MRRGLLALLGVAVAACSSFSSSESAPDGGALEAGGVEAGGADASIVDGGGPVGDADDASPDGAANACTAFDTSPASIAGWTVVNAAGATLTLVTHDGRTAIEANATAGNGRAALVHDIHPGANGEISVSVDLAASTSVGLYAGTLVELVTLSCTTNGVKVALEVDMAGHLLVEATPAGNQVVDFGAPNGKWGTLEIATSLNVLSVELGGMTKTMMLSTALTGAAGCTLSVGAIATGNIAPTSGFYSKACIH